MSQKNATTNNSKARYWVGVCYPENMIPTWQEDIGDILQIPYEYCIHNGDETIDGEERKTHVHIIIAFANTTTYNKALSVLSSLSADGKKCINKCEVVNNVRHMHNYLIHDTDDCKRKKKHLYSASERISGNSFDIGAYEQLSLAKKKEMVRELCDFVRTYRFTNFVDAYEAITDHFDDEYFEILLSYASIIEKLTKGYFHKTQYQMNKETL